MGYLIMKNNINIKIKRAIDIKMVKKIILEISFILASLGGGFLIAYFGKGESFLENEMITAIITLFGFSVTSTVFICQALKQKENQGVNNLIKALAKNLLLTFILIAISLVFDFMSVFDWGKVIPLIIKTFKFSTLIYAFLIQIDILMAFIIIIKK